MSAPAIVVENQCPSLCLVGLRTAGHAPPPLSKPVGNDRGIAAHAPDLAAKCMLYCVLSGMVALRAAGN
eukprot:706471-Pyramimonas_sp.AAC.1